MKGTLFCVVVGLVVVQAFFLDDLHLGGRCMSDTDCTNGCCISVRSTLGHFSHNECRPYHLPGAYCDTATTGQGKDCGCQPGYTCQGDDLGNIAVEAGTHVKGSCMPSGGSASGPQIAVEGGR